MGLVEKQIEFSRMLAKLLIKAEQLGVGLTGGDWFRPQDADYGHALSLHKIRLAVDLNLFVRHGDGWVWVTDMSSYVPLGIYWESIGGSWGGRFGDPCHFSLEHDGIK